MSSIIFVGIGQCGCQILDAFIEQELTCNRQFYPHLLSHGKLSCIFVDTEPKVINKIRNKSKYRKLLKDENLISGLNGRGSNWCYGYYGCGSAPDLCGSVMERVRREIECLDSFLGVVLCHSLGGGTGAGLGSRLTERVREEYPLQQVVSVVVAPSDCGGDNPLQYYNSGLSLASLCGPASADGVLLFHNDGLLGQLGLGLPSPIRSGASVAADRHQVDISMATLNGLVANQIGALLTPCESLYPSEAASAGVGIEINELLRSLCAMPAYKIVRCFTSATGSDWPAAVRSLSRQMKCAYGNLRGTMATVCCYRGDVTGNCHVPSLPAMQTALRSQMHFLGWNEDDAIDVWVGHRQGGPRRVAVAFNSSCIGGYLGEVAGRAKRQFEAGAYLHWFYRHGGSRETFLEGFEALDRVVMDYRDLTAS